MRQDKDYKKNMMGFLQKLIDIVLFKFLMRRRKAFRSLVQYRRMEDMNELACPGRKISIESVGGRPLC
jgi:hypothetical protein